MKKSSEFTVTTTGGRAEKKKKFEVIFAGFLRYFALTNYIMIKIKEILGFAIMDWEWGFGEKKSKKDNSGVNPLCIVLKALC